MNSKHRPESGGGTQEGAGAAAKTGLIARYGMRVFCATMLLPIGLFFAGGGTVGGAFQSLGLFALLLLCLGMHFVMHRMMGRSCHDQAKTGDQSLESNADVTPIAVRRTAP